MLIVCVEEARVEVELVAGVLSCPSCRATLRPWGRARERVLRCATGDRLLRPRRAKCRGCAGTHVLLPDVALLRRQDEVSVIGAAIEAKVAGEGHRRIASRFGVHAGTVRGWLRRFAERADSDQDAFHALCGRARSGARAGIAGRERDRGRAGGDRGRGAGVGAAVRAGRSVADREGVVGRGAAWQHELPSVRRRGDLRPSHARWFSSVRREESGWTRTAVKRSGCSGMR